MELRKAPHAAAIFAGAALTIVLAGCSANGDQNAGQDPPSASASDSSSAPGSNPSESNPSGGQSTTGPSRQPAVPVAQNGQCKAGDLRLSLGGGDAAAGTAYRWLVFTNVSGHSCTLQGYPGVSYVAGNDGHQVGAPAARDGGKGPLIRLGNGQTAAADVGLVNVQNYDAANCRPQPVRGLRVYSPGETRSKFVSLDGTGCANANVRQLTVKPLQRGSGG